MSEVIKEVISFERYKELISSEGCIVKFTADWCGPCKKIAPVYEELSIKYNNHVIFLEVNIDDAKEITNYEDIKSIPLFVFYYKGAKLNSLTIRGVNIGTLINNVQVFVESLIEYKEKKAKTESKSNSQELSNTTSSSSDSFF